MTTSNRTGGTAAGTVAKKVASDIRDAISEGHDPSTGAAAEKRKRKRTDAAANAAKARNPSISFDDPDHKLSAVSRATRELTDGMYKGDAAAAFAKTALSSKASAEAVEGTGLARALAEALEFARKHAKSAPRAIEHATAVPKAGKRGSTAAASLSSDAQRGKRAAAAATLRLAVSALIAAASACNDAARWGTRGPDASRAAADAIYDAAGEELWLSVTEE